MNPLYFEMLGREHHVELLNEAELERTIRVIRRQDHRQLYQEWAYWFGSNLIKWGRKLEHFGTPCIACSPTSVPQRH